MSPSGERPILERQPTFAACPAGRAGDRRARIPHRFQRQRLSPLAEPPDTHAPANKADPCRNDSPKFIGFFAAFENNRVLELRSDARSI